MAYTKLVVDNPTCARRFHLSFDSEGVKAPRVEVRCQQCQAVIFTEENHPDVKLARQENLTKTTELSEHVVTGCQQVDTLSLRTIPKYQEKDAHIYPDQAPNGGGQGGGQSR